MNQANWNDILGKAKEFGKAVGDVAGEVVDASRQKLDEMKKHLLELLRKHLAENKSPEPEQ